MVSLASGRYLSRYLRFVPRRRGRALGFERRLFRRVFGGVERVSVGDGRGFDAVGDA